MKNKGLVITAIIFFLIVNTAYFWEGKLGFWAFPAFGFLIVVFIVLAILLIRQIYLLVKERFTNKPRFFLVGTVLMILMLVYYKPRGLVNFDRLEGQDVLVAQRKGVASCMTTLKLKEDFTFKEKSVCFGVEEHRGTYRISNDTIYFSYLNSEGKGFKNTSLR